MNLIDANYQTFQEEFQAMKGKDKFLAMNMLLKHVLPPPEPINILDGMTEKDLDRLIDYLREKMENEG